MRTKILASTLCLLSFASVSHAGLLKSSFDLALAGSTGSHLFYAFNKSGGATLANWTITGDSVDVVTTGAFNTPDSNLCLDLIGTPDRSGGNGLGGIQQTVHGLTVDQTYNLTFNLAANPEEGLNERALRKTVRIEFFHADNETTPFFSKNITVTVGSQDSPTNIGWTSQTINFTPDTADVTIKLSAVAPEGTTQTKFYCGPLIDNINLVSGAEAAAPEPASLAVLGMGALGLLRRRSRH